MTTEPNKANELLEATENDEWEDKDEWGCNNFSWAEQLDSENDEQEDEDEDEDSWGCNNFSWAEQLDSESKWEED